MVSWYHGIVASWYHGIMVSWYHGIMASWHHGIMASWCIMGSMGRLSGGSLGAVWGLQEASRRHPGGTQETPRRHPEAPRRHPGGQRRLGGKVCQNMCVLLSKVVRPTVSPARERTDPHDLRSLRTKVGGRPARHCTRNTYGYLLLGRQNPYR